MQNTNKNKQSKQKPIDTKITFRIYSKSNLINCFIPFRIENHSNIILYNCM